MSRIRAIVKFANLVEFVAEYDEYEIFEAVKQYIRSNFDLSQQALLDLADTDTHDNFVWFFGEYLQDYQIEFELL